MSTTSRSTPANGRAFKLGCVIATSDRAMLVTAPRVHRANGERGKLPFISRMASTVNRNVSKIFLTRWHGFRAHALRVQRSLREPASTATQDPREQQRQ
jgi:hypothetical protein